MKRHLTIPIMLALALITLPLTAYAWGGGNQPERADRDMHLRQPLNEGQRAELDGLYNDHQGRVGPLHEQLQRLCDAGERNSARARELRTELEELNRSHLIEASSVLSDEQLRDLTELDPDHPIVTGEPRHEQGDGGQQHNGGGHYCQQHDDTHRGR